MGRTGVILKYGLISKKGLVKKRGLMSVHRLVGLMGEKKGPMCMYVGITVIASQFFSIINITTCSLCS